VAGPNLTDDRWLHGCSLEDQVKVITNGIPGTAMIAWQVALSPEEIVRVAEYVDSLKGTAPASPKAPEGEPCP
jgi:cytochrome c oxidase cbb3-type subunit 3